MSKVISTYCLLFFTVVCFLSSVALSAQEVGIYVEETTAEINTPVAVNVRVTNFDTIAGVQFSLNWDTDKLRYTGVSNLGLNASESGNFNLTSTEEGKLGYIVADMTLQGFSLEDDDILFTVQFDVLLPNDAAAAIVFSGDPTSMVVANTSGMSVDSDFSDGQVIVGNPTRVTETYANDPRFTASPNPFHNQTVITFAALEYGEATLSVYDTAGKLVVEKKVTALVGDNTFSLAATDLPAAGVYMLRLATEYGDFNRKLVFNGRR